MNNWLYARLAGSNLKKNRQNVLPYLLSCIGTVMMYFMMASLGENKGLQAMHGASYISMVMRFGMEIVAVFAVIFLIYSNSFLTKRRKKEFGLFHLLGMDKKHIGRILFFESLYLLAFSLAVGIGMGALLYRVMYWALLRLSRMNGTVAFSFEGKALIRTVLLFAGIFLINFLHGMRQIRIAQTVELLHGDQQGEKEPKAKIPVVLLGAGSMGIGYYMALTCKTSLEAMNLFFVAILFVIAGTYCLFSSGSIALLKALKKKKSYYYQSRHFYGISGMLYRMKQNAAGLSNICILSTGVLLVISITACLWCGVDETIHTRYFHQIGVRASGEPLSTEQTEALRAAVDGVLEEKQAVIVRKTEFSYTYVTANKKENRIDASGEFDLTQLTEVKLMELSEYQSVTGTKEQLAKGEVLAVTSDGTQWPYRTLWMGKLELPVAKTMSPLPEVEEPSNLVMDSLTLVFADREDLEAAYEAVAGAPLDGLYWQCGIDLEGDETVQTEMGEAMEEAVTALQTGARVEIRERERGNIYSMYGSILFFGIFVGSLFLMATVMIIYYKQISEGYDDRKRVLILQKVGMSKREVRQSIHSQVLTVFFLPLAMAVLHTTVAFPFTKKIMALMNFGNTNAFLAATGITIVIFGVVYVLVYALTARSYERIVGA